MTFSSTGAKHKPVLDEDSFQQLLEAAYVVQQHNDDQRSHDARLDTSHVLAEIAEIQAAMRVEGLDVTAGARLIADRLRHRTDAAGVSVGLVSDGFLDCVAESGEPARLPGSCLAPHSLVATERLKNGEIFESADSQNDIRLDQALCLQLGIGSLLAAPIQKFGEVAGVIEVRWTRPHAFQDGDIRACQLMASLATSMIERKHRDRQLGKKTPESGAAVGSSPPATPEVFASTPDSWEEILREKSAVLGERDEPDQVPGSSSQKEAAPLPSQCRLCGRPFGPDEAFCGHCSMPRVASATSEHLQSKWASLWFMQQAQDTLHSATAATVIRDDSEATRPSPTAATADGTMPLSPTSASNGQPETAVYQETRRRHWDLSAPAATAVEPERESQASRWIQDAFASARLHLRLRDIVLLLVAIAFGSLLVIAAVRPAPGNGQLTWFESVLVRMGLAEAPAKAPGFGGNPNTRVWVDVHTALYYCQGSELYGKTPGGRFEGQREAQDDQFQPASNTACQ